MMTSNKAGLFTALALLLLLVSCGSEYYGPDSGIGYRVSPYNGQTDVEPDVVIRAAFNRDMWADSFSSGSLTLSSGSSSVSGTVSFDSGLNMVSFTSSTSLAYSTTYYASLSSTISDSLGNNFYGYSWSFTTRAGGWGTAELIESDNSGAAQRPHIAADSSGNAMAVWHQSDGTRKNIWACYYKAGSGWQTPEKLEFDDTADALYPRVAFDNSGNAIAVWYQTESGATYSNIWSNRYVSGSGWGTAEKIDSEDLGAASNPQIAFDGSDNGFAVWQQSGGTYENIWSNRYTAGSGWGTAEKLETDDYNNAQNPKIVADSSGNAIAVWQQLETSALYVNIWGNRYNSGAWGTAQIIDSEDLGDAQTPEINFDTSGNAIVVWSQSDGTRYNIWSNRYASSGSWGTAQLIESDNTSSALGPKVALDSSGNGIAVWYQSDGTRNNIWSNRYDSSGSWGSAQLLEYDDTDEAIEPDLAIDSYGNAIAVWSQADGIRHNIWANRYSYNAGWGTAEQIESEDQGNALYPGIAFGGNNKAFTVWQQLDGIYSIWSNYYY